MSYSTQKRFLRVPFMNETPELKCPRNGEVKLKTYASCADERAWSFYEENRAQYLNDLVACRIYDNEDVGDGLKEMSGGSKHGAQKGMSQDKTVDELNEKIRLLNERLRVLKEEKVDMTLNDPEIMLELKRKISQLRCSSKIDKNDENQLLKMLDQLNKKNMSFKSLNTQKSFIRQPVESLSLEPEKSRDINYLQKEVDRLRQEVHTLRSAVQISHQRKNTSKENINQNCAGYADSEISMEAENKALKDKCQYFEGMQDRILEWKRNSEQLECMQSKICFELKEKNYTIKECQQEIMELECEIKKLLKSSKIKDQELEQLYKSINCYKEENRQLKDEIYRCQCDMRTECCKLKCKIQQYDIQFQQLLLNSKQQVEFKARQFLKLKFECESLFRDFIRVIDELREQRKTEAIVIRNLQDVDSQTNSEHIEELAASTRATLDHITKELESDLAQSKFELETLKEKEKRTSAKLQSKEIENLKLKNSLQKTTLAVKQSLEELDFKTRPGEDCVAEVERLKEFVTNLKSQYEAEKEASIKLTQELEKEKRKQRNPEMISDEIDSLNAALTAVQEEKCQLESQNDVLTNELKKCQNKIKSLQDQQAEMENKNKNLLVSSEASIEEVNKLVKDINSIQDRNENLKSVLDVVDYSDEFKKEIENLKKQLEAEIEKCQNLTNQNKMIQNALDQAIKKNDEIEQKLKKCDEQKTENVLTNKNDEVKVFKPEPNLSDGLALDSRNESAVKILKPEPNVSDSLGLESRNESAPILSDATVAQPSKTTDKEAKYIERKAQAKINQLKKVHELQRKTERANFEKEIKGHRLSNEILQKSLTELTTKVQIKSFVDFEKDIRKILDSFVQEISMWRCEKLCKLTKLQEICKKIADFGINCLGFKELVYLHQQISDAAVKLRAKGIKVDFNSKRELICCKCSGDICNVPYIPKEKEKTLLEKMSILEREIQVSRDLLRKSKIEHNLSASDSDQTDIETVRANTSYQFERDVRNISKFSLLPYNIQDEFEVPTKETTNRFHS